MRDIVILVLPEAFLISPTSAAALTGNGLQEFCSGPEGSSKSLGCTLYVQGFVAGIQPADGTKRKDTRMWCFPDGSTIGQTRLIVEKYMRDNPQALHQEASIIVGKSAAVRLPLQKFKLTHYRKARDRSSAPRDCAL